MERHRDIVAEADIVDQNGNVEVCDQALDAVEVLVLVGGEVHGESLGLDIVLGADVGGESVEFALGAGDEEDVVALLRELERILFAETVGGAGHESPGALLAELGELVEC